MGILEGSAQAFWQSARKRLGGVDPHYAVQRAKRELKQIDRAKTARQLGTFVTAASDVFANLPVQTIEEMIRSKPKDMMLTLAVAIDKMDKLEDRPPPVQEVKHVHSLDRVAQVLLAEAQRRGITLDVPRGDYSVSDDTGGSAQRLLEAEGFRDG